MHHQINNIFIEPISQMYNCDLQHIHLNPPIPLGHFYETLPKFGVTDRNSPLVKYFYTQWDKTNEYKILYTKFLVETLPKLFPTESHFICQKTPNIRIHIPNQTNIGILESDPHQNVIGLHKDSDFGHPSEEWNVIIPLTPMFKTNSIFYEETQSSELPFDQWKPVTVSKTQLWIGHLNSLRHFNKINKTGVSRVSLDIRVIPGSKYVSSDSKVSVTSKKKFTVGEYYMRLDIEEQTSGLR